MLHEQPVFVVYPFHLGPPCPFCGQGMRWAASDYQVVVQVYLRPDYWKGGVWPIQTPVVLWCDNMACKEAPSRMLSIQRTDDILLLPAAS